MEKNLTNVSAKSTAKKSAKKCEYNVSQKAYDGFVRRIEKVTNAPGPARECLMDAMHAYLLSEGKEDSSGEMNLDCRVTFGFLRYELDAALLRSRRARERAQQVRERKLQEKAEHEAAEMADTTDVRISKDNASAGRGAEITGNETKSTEPARKTVSVMMSRRERRAAARRARKKGAYINGAEPRLRFSTVDCCQKCKDEPLRRGLRRVCLSDVT